jgi:hypothetical protein
MATHELPWHRVHWFGLLVLAMMVGTADGEVPAVCKAKSRGGGHGGAAARAWKSIEKECRDKLEANRTQAAMRCLEGHFLESRTPGRRDGDWFTTLRKLRHDAEMFTWLHEENLVKQEVKKLWRGIYHSARDKNKHKPDKVFEVNFQEQNDDRKLWQNSNNKAVYIDKKGKETPKRTVRAQPGAFKGVEDSFREVGRAVVDRLLADRTLKDIRRFLQASTFYFYPRPGQHLVALLEDGLASPLMAQLSDGLRLSMPETLGPLPLTGIRAWKADNSPLTEGEHGEPELTNSSADAAASVLIWTVPGSSLNGTAEGALELYSRSADVENEEPIARIKYMANRAVIWNSDLQAIWKGPGWKSGFLKRGIHLLLNYGWSSCEQ